MVALHCLPIPSAKEPINSEFKSLLESAQAFYRAPKIVMALNKYFIHLGIDYRHFDFNHFTFMKELINPSGLENFHIVVVRYDEWRH